MGNDYEAFAEEDCPPGTKFDGEKERWDLLPLAPVKEVVKVLTVGARKYAPNNWQQVPEGKERYYAAAQRHLVTYRLAGEGERAACPDEETGLHHVAHAIRCLLFVLWLELTTANYHVKNKAEEEL